MQSLHSEVGTIHIHFNIHLTQFLIESWTAVHIFGCKPQSIHITRLPSFKVCATSRRDYFPMHLKTHMHETELIYDAKRIWYYRESLSYVERTLDSLPIVKRQKCHINLMVHFQTIATRKAGLLTNSVLFRCLMYVLAYSQLKMSGVFMSSSFKPLVNQISL